MCSFGCLPFVWAPLLVTETAGKTELRVRGSHGSHHPLGPGNPSRSSGEVRISWYCFFLLFVYLRGTLPTKKCKKMFPNSNHGKGSRATSLGHLARCRTFPSPSGRLGGVPPTVEGGSDELGVAEGREGLVRLPEMWKNYRVTRFLALALTVFWGCQSRKLVGG